MAQRTNIEGRDRGFTCPAFNPTTADVEGPLKIFRAAAHRVAEHDLFNGRAGVLGLLADHSHIDRRLTPAIDVEAEMQDFGLDQCPRSFLSGEKAATGQEKAAKRKKIDVDESAEASGYVPKAGAHVHMTAGQMLTFARHSIQIFSNLGVPATDPAFQAWQAHICVLNALMGLYNSYDLDTPFQLDSWKGTSKMRPCFGAIRIGSEKVSDQELYDLLTDARGDGDKAKVEQLCRNAVTTIREGLGVTEPVDVKVDEPAVDPEAAELF